MVSKFVSYLGYPDFNFYIRKQPYTQTAMNPIHYVMEMADELLCFI
jgi:hypothetical protein